MIEHTNQKIQTKVALILPAFNEEKTISKTIKSFALYIPEALFVIINNNSKDQTKALAIKTCKKLKITFLLLDEKRQGKANAVRLAFQKVVANVYLLCDADCTYPAYQSNQLIQPILRGEVDLVIGDRLSKGHYKKENKRIFHSFGNTLVRWIINKLFRCNLKDIMSGYRALSYRFIKNYPILIEGFELETDMLAHALDKKITILEIPVDYKDRPKNSFSKLKTISDGFRVMRVLIQVFRYYKPFAFFFSFFILFFVLGISISIPVLQDWILYQHIYRVPLAILSVGLEIIAFLMLCLALILDAISRQDKFNFEKDYYK